MEQSALERPAHQLGTTREAELPHQASPLGLGGAHRDVQLACHITVRVAIGEQERCSLFAFRELVIEHSRILLSADAAGIGKRTSSSSVLSTSVGQYCGKTAPAPLGATVSIDSRTEGDSRP